MTTIEKKTPRIRDDGIDGSLNVLKDPSPKLGYQRLTRYYNGEKIFQSWWRMAPNLAKDLLLKP